MIKKILLISGLVVLSSLCLTGCKKKSDVSSTSERYYAKNDTSEQTTEEPIDDTTTVTEEPSSTDDTEIENVDPLEYKYNVDDDSNSNENLSKDTISIDGKLISFPCEYTHLKDIFDKLYVSEIDSLSNEVKYTKFNEKDYSNIDGLDLIYKPTTGEGNVTFTLVSPDGNKTSIDKCICNEVNLSVSGISNKKLMTIALPNNIHFGSTVKDIKSYYGKVVTTYNEYKNNSFVIEYTNDSNDYYFSGKSGGLSEVILKYNIDTTNNTEHSNNNDVDYYDDKDDE